jgi:hypothetical protein
LPRDRTVAPFGVAVLTKAASFPLTLPGLAGGVERIWAAIGARDPRDALRRLRALERELGVVVEARG